MLQSSLQQVVCAVGAESGSVWLYDQEKGGRIYPSFWFGSADLTGLSLALGEGVAGDVVQSGKTLVVKDCGRDERWAGRFDKKTGFVTKSMICVPLVHGQKIIGCIQVINKKNDDLYCDQDVSLCQKLASLIAAEMNKKN